MRKLPVLQGHTLRVAAIQRNQIAQEWTSRTLSGPGMTHVACHKGCHDCCYHPLYVTLLEAFWLYRSLVEHHQWSPQLRKTLQETSELTLGLNPTTWVLSMIPCPFLAEGQCSIYDSRPLSCRVTIANRDPYYCHPHRIKPGDTSIMDRSWAQTQLRDREAPMTAQLGLPYIQLPLSSGLTIVDGWHQGNQTLEDLGWTLKTVLNR